MNRPSDPLAVRLIPALRALHERALGVETAHAREVDAAHPSFRDSARNLVHYYRLTADNRLLMGGGPVGLSFGANMERDEQTSAWEHIEQHMRWVFPALKDLQARSIPIREDCTLVQ